MAFKFFVADERKSKNTLKIVKIEDNVVNMAKQDLTQTVGEQCLIG